MFKNVNRQIVIRVGSKTDSRGFINFPAQPDLINEKISGVRMLGRPTGFRSVYGLNSKMNQVRDYSYFYTLVDCSGNVFCRDAPSVLFGAPTYAIWNTFKPRKINFSECSVRFYDSLVSESEIYVALLISE